MSEKEIKKLRIEIDALDGELLALLNRRAAAGRSLDFLGKKVDGVVAFPNDELLTLAPQLPLLQAFRVLGTIMARPLADLARAMTRADVATLRDFLRGAPRWRFGAGEGRSTALSRRSRRR